MQIQIQDRAPLEKVRKLSDGRLTAVVRFARSGVYQYQGAEVGRPELSTVNVYRPEDEVFSQDSMASFAHKAVTLSHPGQPVDAANWKAVAVGYTDGRVSLTTGAVSGKHHTPSAPGTPPNQDSGVLGNNIETVQVSTLKVEVSSNAPYAAAQEFGNSRLPERPYMRPAAAKMRKPVAKLVARALSKEGV